MKKESLGQWRIRRERELYAQFAEEAAAKKRGPEILLRAIPYTNMPNYRPEMGRYTTLAKALRDGSTSGIGAWTGPTATAAGYPPEGRLGQLWIEKVGQPATLDGDRVNAAGWRLT